MGEEVRGLDRALRHDHPLAQPGGVQLVQHAGEIIPRDALLLRVWGYGSEIRTRTLDVHVRRLRKKLGGYADQYIETIFGIGYRFQPFHAPRFFQPAVVKPFALGA